MTDVLQSVDMNVNRQQDGSPKKKKKRLSVERIYQKKSQLEHILLRPDAYIGSVEPEQQNMWVLDESDGKTCIVQKQITLVPGFYKIFDEILVNAADNKQRDKEMNTIKIVIDQEKNFISVWNNGKGIPIEVHKEQNMYVPTLIFGHLLTSSNYDDTQKKVTGGRNGYGAKLCNIFSKKFTVETACNEYGKKFKQVWQKNMTKAEDPNIVEFGGKDYTKISYTPDLEKFHMEKLDDDIVSLLKRRAYDIAGTSKGVAVFLNGTRINIKNFREYVELYMKGASKMAIDDDEDGAKPKIIHEIFSPRWEVCVTVSRTGFQQSSFVNSIATTKGGTHVNYIVDQIVEKMITAVQRKASKEMKVRPFQIRNHIWIFVNCLIENPTFDSQTKENMTLRAKAFGSTCEVNEKFIKMVQGCGVMDSIMSWVKFKSQEKMNQKCSANKRSKVKIPKLDDANEAGSKSSSQCTLILTEGDSAKTLAISGLGVIGRDRYGVFPLRGKLLNVRDAPSKQIAENAEITNLLQILGLNFKKKYMTEEERKTLRYGKVMIMTDQDQDGSHIKGLVINFIHANWPHLLRSNFLEEFITPIVKVSKGKEKFSFFSLPEFEEWKRETPNHHTWKVKYYKGLGTSTSDEAKEYFKGMARHRIGFSHVGTSCDQAIEMAFSKKHIQSRKDWLTRGMEERRRRRALGMPEIYLYHKDTRDVTYTDFVNKELILFSNADNERSIPSLVDGLKPGQRKVLFTCFKRNDKKEVKVAQLAGSVAELSAYHHGENSLLGTIINLAQNFVGSNNINLLQPIGAFGSRIHGGKDAASPRYIFTMLSPLARFIFPAKDDVLLNYLSEDNQKIEPEWYCPIIPMVLVNGADGIGTGYRSLVFNHCPRQIVANLKRLIAGEQPEPMMPFFKGFKGTIEQVDTQKFVVTGNCNVVDEKTFEITELPVKTWTSPYKESVLDVFENGSVKVKPVIAATRDYSSDKTVHFIVTLTSEEEMAKAEEEGLAKKFKLEVTLNNSSMVLHDRYGCLKKYESADEIMKEFFEVRLEKYREQKAYYEGFLEAESLKLDNQARFILEKIEGTVVIENRPKRDVVMSLVERGYPSDPVKTWKAENRREADDGESETGSSVSSVEAGPDFGYLLSMSLLSLSKEKKEDLLAQRDAKREELERLKMKTPEDLWMEDLDAFSEELDRVQQLETEMDEESEKLFSRVGDGKRQTKLTSKGKVKKQAGESKKAPKKKEVKVPTDDKPALEKENEEKPSQEPLSLAERLAQKAGSKKSLLKKPAAARKKTFEFGSSDEEDIGSFSDGEVSPVKRQTRKKVQAYVLSDSEDEENTVSSKDDDQTFSVSDVEEDAEPDEDSASEFDVAQKTASKGKSKTAPRNERGIRKKAPQGEQIELSDSENSEVEATKALIAKLTPTKSKPDKCEKESDACNDTKKSKPAQDLLDIASSDSDGEKSKLSDPSRAKKQRSIFDYTSSSKQGSNPGTKSSKTAKTTKAKTSRQPATSKTSVAKKRPAKKSSEDDSELPVKKTAAKKAGAKKKKSRVLSDDDSVVFSDEENVDIEVSAPREKRPGRGPSKVCYQISDDDDDDDEEGSDFEL